MSSTLDKLNLKPGEKRLLIGIGLVLFVVLNIWFVWPHFGDWARIRNEMDTARQEISKFEAEIAKKDAYERRLEELQAQGSNVMAEEQALQLQRQVQSQAIQSKVAVTRYDPRNSSRSDNPFFEERSILVTFTAKDPELIHFLYNLAAGDSQIRVRDMVLKTDQPQYKLQGTITLVASYQKSQ